MRHNRSKKAQRELREQRPEPWDDIDAAGNRVRLPVLRRPQPRDHRPSEFGISLLLGMQRKPVWSGVSDPGAVTARREANRAARRARRAVRVGR